MRVVVVHATSRANTVTLDEYDDVGVQRSVGVCASAPPLSSAGFRSC